MTYTPKLYEHGQIIHSYGGTFAYQIIGAVCRLYDREELPYPSCSLQWKGKQPSWNRIGKRFVPDIATRRCPSYNVQLLTEGYKEMILTLYPEKLSDIDSAWWCSVTKKQQNAVLSDINHPQLSCAS